MDLDVQSKRLNVYVNHQVVVTVSAGAPFTPRRFQGPTVQQPEQQATTLGYGECRRHSALRVTDGWELDQIPLALLEVQPGNHFVRRTSAAARPHGHLATCPAPHPMVRVAQARRNCRPDRASPRCRVETEVRTTNPCNHTDHKRVLDEPCIDIADKGQDRASAGDNAPDMSDRRQPQLITQWDASGTGTVGSICRPSARTAR